MYTILSCSCSKKEEKLPPLINPPVNNLDVEFAKYTISADEGGVINYLSGSSVIIPANAFTDSLGNVIKGEVTVMYREFHDAADILLSGIPMTIKDSLGKEDVFQTAGMLEIRAEKDGKNILLQNGKSIDLKTASFQEDDGYGFYYLDEENRNWAMQGTPGSEVNTEKVNLLKDIEKRRPEEFPYDPNKYFVFEYFNFLDIYLNDNSREIRKRRDDPTIKKKAHAYGMSTYGLNIYSPVKYNGRDYPAGQILWRFTDERKSFPNWVNEMSYWEDTVKFTYYGANKYGLLLENVGEEQEYHKLYTEIEAVMPLKYLMRHSPDYWKKNYDEALTALEEEEIKAQKMASIYRSFKVNQMGIYNYDYLLKQDDNIVVQATFDIDWPVVDKKDFTGQMVDKSVYLVLGDNRTLIKFPESDWDRVGLVPDEGARLFAIVSNGDNSWLQLFTNDKFKQIDFSNLKNQTMPKYHFSFDKEKIQIESDKDIRAVLGLKDSRNQPVM
ncbi:hypothetical protein [Chondrinema litorale]|uniref:hypothetical protein n=1 Tax=Chondrinema litorale TaxID=2994555 RepID=UPI002543A485|nr:hypothetical protein [Chondrinema litorale]UZR95663.1 hypothetical protein OQ292_07550 [Chondrinema litorale]